MKNRVIIALGGNAILNKGEKGTYEEQYQNVYTTMESLLFLFQDENYEILLTHGNGPQVGNILIQNDAAKSSIPEMPMYACGAETQGLIGLFIQNSLNNIFKKNNIKKSVATVVTQVEVNSGDPSFENPSKPVGPFYTQEEATEISGQTGYKIVDDAGRGFRRVVPSPEPISIVELEAIEDLLESDNIVIACGGGGIPVVRKNDRLEGVDAVIDKDKTASLLGDELNADILVILTAVDKVALNFGKENQESLNSMTIEEAKKYLTEDHFAAGSMKPKIEASVAFIEKETSRKALITHPAKMKEAFAENDGTWIKY